MSFKPDQQALLRAYRKSDHELRLRYAKIGTAVGIIMVIPFFFLDSMVYAQNFEEFSKIRFLWILAWGIILAAFHTALAKYVKVMGVITCLMPGLFINWMIAITEGAASPYYAGLNLMSVFMAVFLPWTVLETAIVSCWILSLYVIACAFNYINYGVEQFPWIIFSNNIFFLSASTTLCIIASYYNTRRRFSEFCLRYELDQSNSTLEAKNKELAELDELKSQFFANVSHELRTPLTLILAPLQDLVNRVDLSSDVKSLLGLMRQNGLRLLRLVNDLLDVIRLEKKQVALRLESVELNAFLSGLVDSIQHLARAQELTIHKQLEGTVWIEGDKASLEKIFLNVLHNSIKFTPAQGSIHISSQCLDGFVQVIIQDTGIGIASSELHHVFERFRQADGSSTRKFQGVGLGLSLVKELTELQGGRVSLDSKVNQGSQVVIQLPLLSKETAMTVSMEEKESSLAAIYQAAQREGVVIPSSLFSQLNKLSSTIEENHQPTVLIVDDEPDMRQYLVSSLQKDYQVLSATSGKEALVVIGQYKPLVIILDVMMPGLDGLELCRQLKARADTGDIKIIMLTARVDEDAKLQALQYGADDFLTKPFSSDELKLRVKNQCQAVQSTQLVQTKNQELTEALEKLKHTEAQLFQSEKLSAVGQLAAGLLHELNNPLNAALVMLSIMKDKFRPLQDMVNVEEIDVIEEGLRKIHRVVSEVKVFAYPTAIEDRKPMAFKGLVDSALCFVKQDDYDIEIDLPEDITVEVSPMHIIQVLIHLLTNAQKATESYSEPKIGIKAQLKGNHLEVCVWDNGIGISPENQQKIFEPFYTTREIGQGLGLGLSVSYSIIKQHGSELTVKSQFQQGTKMIFQLLLA